MTTRIRIAALAMGVATACSGNGSMDGPLTSPTPAPSLVAGSVTYRERMALPADATVDVWITDIGPGLVAQAILAEATVQAAGRQVPLPFEVRIDPTRVQATRPYGLRAVIRTGGQVLFETPQPVPVLTQGAPTTVTVMLTRVGGDAPATAAAAAIVGSPRVASLTP